MWRVLIGADPIQLISKKIKESCKKTKSPKHESWLLLEGGRREVGSLAKKFEEAILYGFATGEGYTTLFESARSLVADCIMSKTVDLANPHAKYRKLVENYQCMKLWGKK